MTQTIPARPASATPGLVALATAVAMLASFFYLRLHDPFSDTVDRVLFMAGCTAAASFAVDQLLRWRMKPAPMAKSSNGNLPRSLVKFLGFVVTLLIVGLAYLLFPEYRGDFYTPYYRALGKIALPVLILALPYIYLVDRRMAQPRDGNWAMGMAVLLRFSRVDAGILRQHLLGWTVKGFFLPLMFVYTCDNLNNFLHYDFSQLTRSYRGFYGCSYDFMYFVDVVIALIGYVFALRLFDTQIRSTEPTPLGWITALICYVPFWPWISRSYLDYGTGRSWGDWFATMPALYDIWGSLILLLVVVYVWATIAFGMRFSNLTNRGIITNGPYRWTKHPAYIAKNISWWLISMPFFTIDLVFSVRCCILLLLLNGIYFLRARTEERHLLLDPVYRDYAAWISQHGIFRWLKLPLPAPIDDHTLRQNALTGRNL